MLQIRREQMECFDDLAKVNFYQRLQIFLREEMHEETENYNDESLLKYIQENEKSANKFGIETESGIAQWCCLTLILGTKLEDIPEFQPYMKDNSLSTNDPEEKLDKLVDYLNFLENIQS